MPIELVDVDEFTTPITVPQDGDDYDAASVELPFQQLANRTVSLGSRIDAVPDEPHTWTAAQGFEDTVTLHGAANEFTYWPPRLRSLIIEQTAASARMGATDAALLGSGSATPFGWIATAAGATIIYTFRLPHGATLKRVRAAIASGRSENVTVSCFQRESAVDGVATGATVVTNLGTITQAITAAIAEVITHVIPSPVVTDGSRHTYCVEVLLTAVGQVCAWLEVQFLDPGPRNF